MNDDNEFFGGIGIGAIAIIVVIVGAFLSGLVISQLWSWFIVDTFGVPKISVPVAIGISLIVGKLTHQEIDKKESDKTKSILYKLVEAMTTTILGPLLYLVIGWIVYQFV